MAKPIQIVGSGGRGGTRWGSTRGSQKLRGETPNNPGYTKAVKSGYTRQQGRNEETVIIFYYTISADHTAERYVLSQSYNEEEKERW